MVLTAYLKTERPQRIEFPISGHHARLPELLDFIFVLIPKASDC
jgi:hypothetical protein